MKLVKLNAINSTNDFLKELAKDTSIDNLTVVVAEKQTSGRGQIKNKWQSEPGKNLTFSILCKFKEFDVSKSFFLNCVASLAVFDALYEYIPEKLTVKWPNDIMSASKKLVGILIENTVINTHIFRSVIGVGLNVNQEHFHNLPKATSLKKILDRDIDKDKLLYTIIENLKKYLNYIEQKAFDQIKATYEANLYKINVPSMFEDAFENKFMGRIEGINDMGKLVVALENETIRTFDLKEIKFI